MYVRTISYQIQSRTDYCIRLLFDRTMRLYFFCLLILLYEGFVANYSIDEKDRTRGDYYEPQLLSFRVLEGVTEPLTSGMQSSKADPLWRQLKAAADTKAAHKQVQLALSSYGQLLRNPLLFGEMPLQVLSCITS